MAVRRLIVQLRLSGLNPSLRGIRLLGNEVGRAADEFDRLTGSARRAGVSVGAVYTARQRMAGFARGWGGGGGWRGPAPRNPRNPRQQASSADRMVESLLTSRLGRGIVSPLVGRLLRIAKPDLKLSGAGTAESFGQLFSRSGMTKAFGMVTRGAAAAGRLLVQFATKNPILAAGILLILGTVSAAVVLGKAMVGTARAAAEAAQRLSEFAAARVQSGGSNETLATLAALGIPVGSISARARAFREHLASDPMAMSAGLSLGISPQLPRNLGGTDDEAKLLLTTLTRLREMFKRNEESARRYARQLDAEDLLPLVMVSDQQWERQKRSIETTAKIMGKGQQEATDFNSALRTLLNNWEIAKTAFGRAAMPGITRGLNAIGDALRRFAEIVDSNPQVAAFLGRLSEKLLKVAADAIDLVNVFLFVQGAIQRFVLGIYDLVRNVAGKAGIKLPDLSGQLNAAQNANTQALKQNTQALQQNNELLLKPGRYGKAPAGVPSRLTGQSLNDAARSGAFALGYFNF